MSHKQGDITLLGMSLPSGPRRGGYPEANWVGPHGCFLCLLAALAEVCHASRTASYGAVPWLKTVSREGSLSHEGGPSPSEQCLRLLCPRCAASRRRRGQRSSKNPWRRRFPRTWHCVGERAGAPTMSPVSLSIHIFIEHAHMLINSKSGYLLNEELARCADIC